MHRFTLLVFTVSILLVGCSASTYLMNTPKPSPEKEIQQTLESWEGKHISQVMQTLGSPHGITDNETGSKIYIWQIPVTPLPREQYHQITPKQRQPNGIRLVTGAAWATNETYELMFYTDLNGVIYKTGTKRDLHGSAGSRSSRPSQVKPAITK